MKNGAPRSIREAPEELTLRAEAVGTKKSCINADHIAQERWGPPLVDAAWHAFCQAIYKGIGWRRLGIIVRLLLRNKQGSGSEETT